MTINLTERQISIMRLALLEVMDIITGPCPDLDADRLDLDLTNPPDPMEVNTLECDLMRASLGAKI